MPKQKRLLLAIAAISPSLEYLGRFALSVRRVVCLVGLKLQDPRFVAGLLLLALPLFSLTRVGTGTQRAYALPSDNLNFQARLETNTGAIAPTTSSSTSTAPVPAALPSGLRPGATTLVPVSALAHWAPTTVVSGLRMGMSASTSDLSPVSQARYLGISSSTSP